MVHAFPSVVVTPAAAQALRHGIAPTVQELSQCRGTFQRGETVAVLDADGSLLAMASPTFGSTEWTQVAPDVPAARLRRVFVGGDQPVPPADTPA
jgi:glutamate 5-kinase